MIKLSELLGAHPSYGLWHGTRAVVSNGLDPGTSAVGEATEAIRIIWQRIAAEKQMLISDIESYEVMDFFDGPDALRHAVALGNSIRYLKGDFDYAVVAFAFDKFSARGYAEQGSELANAMTALIRSALQNYAQFFQDVEARNNIEHAQQTAQRLLSGEPKVMRLVKLPANGFFWSHGRPDVPVSVLSRPPFADRIAYSELFFSGHIPLDHFEIEYL